MTPRALVLALALAAALAGCGKRGDPIPPPDGAYPRSYPAPPKPAPR